MSHYLTIIASSSVSTVLLLAVTYIYCPEWIERTKWRILGWGSSLAAIVSSVLVALIVVGLEQSQIASASLAISLSTMTFVTVQCLYTDFRYRKGDRWTLRTAIGLNLLSGGTLVLTSQGHQEKWMYTLLILMSLILFLIPSLGKSDARAVLLSVLAVFPPTGTLGMQWGMLVMAMLLGIYGLLSIPKKQGLKGTLTTKVSIPMIPIIVGSFLIAEVCAVLPQG